MLGRDLLLTCNYERFIDDSVNLELDLVAHYPLNNDSSGKDWTAQFDATSSGSIVFDDVNTNFDGTNDYLTVSNTISTSSVLTISMWIEPNNQDAVPHYILKGANNFILTQSHNSHSDVGFFDGVSWKWSGITLSSTQWSHLILIVNGASLTMMIDKVVVWTTSINVNTIGTSLLIGTADGASGFFAGKLSNLRIYERVINPFEISALYDEGLIPNLPKPTTRGLKSYYPLHGTAIDEHGEGTNDSGTLYNGVTFLDESIFKGSKTAKFDGVNDEVQSTIPPMTSTNASFSVWVRKSTGGGANGESIVTQGRALDDYFSRGISLDSTDKPYMLGRDSSDAWKEVKATTSLVVGRWYHIVGIQDGTVIKLYVDNVLIGTLDMVTSTTYQSNIRLGIPADIEQHYSASLYAFSGDLSNVRLYDRAITEVEIGELYSEGYDQTVTPTTTNLVAHYKFNSDTTRYTNNGGVTLVDDATRGFVNSFNGTDGFIDYGSQVGGHTDFSISTWFLNDNNYSVRKCMLINNDCIFRIQDGGDMAIWDNRDGTGAYTILNYTLSNYLVAGWNHIVLSVQGATYVLKINNVTVSFTTTTGSFTSSLVNMTIGKDTRNNNNYFTSSLSDMRVYGRALSDAEITSLFNEVQQPSDYVYYFPLTGAVDETGSYNGVEKGTLLYNGKQRGKSVAYVDGVDDHFVTPISVAQNMSFSFRCKGNFAISNESTTSIINRLSLYSTNNGVFLTSIVSRSRDGSSTSGDYKYRAYNIEHLKIRVGDWYYVNFEYVDPMTYNLYLNDTFIDDATLAIYIASGILDAPAGTITLGRWDYNGVVYYNSGYYSDFRVYDAILSSADVGVLYNDGVVENNLLTYYPLTEISRNDDLWASFDGVEYGSMGYIKNADYGVVANFDGTNDYINTPHVPKNNSFTWSFWFKLDSTESTDGCFLGDYNGTASTYNQFFVWFDKISGGGGTDCVSFVILQSTDSNNWLWLESSTVSLNTWYHCVVVRDKGVDSRIYINGVDDTQYKRNPAGLMASTDSILTMRIGATSETSRILDGNMRDVRIYDAVLTDKEISGIYKTERVKRFIDIDKDLTAYYPLERNSLCYSENQVDGVDTAVTYDGVGASFNGTTSRINNDYTFTTPANGQCCVAFWVNVVDSWNTQTVIVDGGNTNGFECVFSGGDLWCGYTVGGVKQLPNNLLTYVPNNTWTHIVFTFGNEGSKIYKNGVLADSVNTTVAVAEGTDYSTIGALYNSSPYYLDQPVVGGYSRFFNGKVANARYYKRGLNEDEVTFIYNKEKSKFGL